MLRYAVLLFMISVGLPAAVAHPTYFHERQIAKTCTEHPVKAAGGHLPPITDSDITVTAVKDGQALKDVCPGESYTLTVGFGGQPRAALMTVSGGTLKDGNVAGCTNAVTTEAGKMVTSLKSNWEVPCSLLGRVEVKVTTAAGGAGAWLKGSSGFTILPISKCPGYNKCKASSQIPDFPSPPKVNETALARANATKQPTELDANGPLFFAVNPPAGMPGNFHSGGRMCAASNQGYQCSINAAQGITIHYSYGGHAPVNVCTNKTGAERAARNSSTMMHFAIQTQQLGYVGLGFPLAPGRMVPADAVIARLDNATGGVKVHSYRLTAQHAGGIRPAPGWVYAMGAVRRSSSSSSSSSKGGSGDVLMLCFSRQAMAKASLVPNLDPTMTPIIWSSHVKDAFVSRHDKDGSMIINMLSGQHAVINKNDNAVTKPNWAMHIAHAAAMMAAFCFLMPLSGLIARHRWVFTPKNQPYDPRAGGAWFPIHFFTQLLGSAAAIGSYVLAMLLWFRKNSLGFERHVMYAPHCELGTGVMAMVAVQLLVGGMRFCIPESYRSSWRLMHSMWGWATVAAGGANCVLGTFLMRDLLGMPWLIWLIPAAGSLGGLMLIGMLLEVPRMRRVKEMCCWEDDMSDVASLKSRAKSTDAAVEIGPSRPRTSDNIEFVLSPRTASPRLESPRAGPAGPGSPLPVSVAPLSPRLTGNCPDSIRPVA